MSQSPKATTRLPNFLLIGAQKSGTTSLFGYLKQHPDIYMCPVKEPLFFAYEGGVPDFKGPAANEHPFWRSRPVELAQYQELFKDAGDEKIVGEASTYYICEPRAVENIKVKLPNAKLVALLRNPVERAYSNYLHCRKNGLETEASFGSALALEEQRTRDGWGMIWRYRWKGNYFDQLKRFYELFDSQQILICFTDDLVNQPVELVRKILAFLDVDPEALPDVSKRLNQSSPGLIQQHPLDEVTRNQLIEYYREGILSLQDLAERDLSNWLK